jgi:hypothetical protein
MVRILILIFTLGILSPSLVHAGCGYFRDPEGQLRLGAGNERDFKILIRDSGNSHQVVKQVCDATFDAISCKTLTSGRDEYIQGEHDGFGMTPTVFLGSERVQLTIGRLDPWIAQFAAENYEDDQHGVYGSLGACEYHRSRIAVEAAERSHDVFLDQQRERERAERMRNYPTNFHGLKH